MKGLKKIGVTLLAGVLCVLGGGVGAGCKEEKDALTVYMPDGAPALAFAKLMHEDGAEDELAYKVVSPELIASKVTNKDADKNADVCVLPWTAASKLLGSGDEYKAIATLTHGNLYLVAAEAGTLAGLGELVGKTVGVLKINEVPGLTFKVTLKKQGVPYQEVENDGGKDSTKVNLVAMSSPQDTTRITADYYLLAEPAASLRGKIVGDLQALYGGAQGYPQAVMVAKSDLLEEGGGWVSTLTDGLRASIEWALHASGETLVQAVQSHFDDQTATTSLKAPMLTAEVVGRCGLRYEYVAENAGRVEEFLTDLRAVNEKAAAIPQAKFYWSHAK